MIDSSIVSVATLEPNIGVPPDRTVKLADAKGVIGIDIQRQSIQLTYLYKIITIHEVTVKPNIKSI